MTSEMIRAGEVYNSLEIVSIAKKTLRRDGYVIRVKPYEKALWVKIETDTVTIAFQTFLVRESARRVTYLKEGVRAATYSRATDEVLDTMEVWSPEPPTVSADVNYGTVQSPELVAERRERERMAHRVGSAANPLDSFARVVQTKSTPEMERYW